MKLTSVLLIFVVFSYAMAQNVTETNSANLVPGQIYNAGTCVNVPDNGISIPCSFAYFDENLKCQVTLL